MTRLVRLSFVSGGINALAYFFRYLRLWPQVYHYSDSAQSKTNKLRFWRINLRQFQAATHRSASPGPWPTTGTWSGARSPRLSASHPEAGTRSGWTLTCSTGSTRTSATPGTLAWPSPRGRCWPGSSSLAPSARCKETRKFFKLSFSDTCSTSCRWMAIYRGNIVCYCKSAMTIGRKQH